MAGNNKLGTVSDTGVWVATSSKLIGALIAGASKAVRDGRVAIAASATRVIVVWATCAARQLMSV